MAELNDRLIFETDWFARTALRGIESNLTGRRDLGEGLETQLLRHLLLSLLDAQKGAATFRHRDMLNFFAFCQGRIDASRSQILQDLWVLYMTKERQGGYFVEFGACDGHLLSNSMLLEQAYGWIGVLAEPNPVWHDALQRNRKAMIFTECVAARSGEEVEFLSTDTMPELSRMADIVPDDVHEKNGNRAVQTRYRVPTLSLNDLLHRAGAPGEIDYLSIDTEGSEYEILRHLDFDRWKFRLITVEHAGEAEKREAIYTLLNSHGYRRWNTLLSRWDDWYVHSLDVAR